ncbi:hypothetical protein [Mucilaginibacter paludis]|uniref:Uncharacterized protein n=1 Tax=Mucilaginibacter paludis DSM 18603 TaxID=714943 RepID=H1YHZ0_9SPHI|nr:hypothetical protein [Mucilaginibacter paludis]EHQ25538.1 hypothetical protein Mucpa_1378 [Mucilaginibacter paludis DSM 18603]
MKKHLILTIAITASANSYATAKHNSPKLVLSKPITSLYIQQDTAKYLYEHVVLQKAKYQHKELNDILNSLNIEVKSYLLSHGRKVGYRTGITLFFENRKNISEKLERHIHTHSIYIEFEKPIPLDLINSSLQTGHDDEWQAVEKEFFGKHIVSDIQGSKP